MFSAFASAELFKLSCVARSAALTVDEFFAIFSEQLPAVLRDEWPVYFRDDLCGLSLVFLSNLLFVLLTVLSLLFLDDLSKAESNKNTRAVKSTQTAPHILTAAQVYRHGTEDQVKSSYVISVLFLKVIHKHFVYASVWARRRQARRSNC